MTNGQSESTELQENQDRPSYQKLPSDEEPEKAVNTSKHRLSVEVELNKGTKESSTDDDSLKGTSFFILCQRLFEFRARRFECATSLPPPST